ncbi:MAG: penicillin acylase family protein, partial [Pseudomonadota bacterium]
MRVLVQGAGALLASTALTGAAIADDHNPFKADITRTTHNIAHIEADTWEGVGYGVAYAYAQDNICMLAEEFVSVRGERSLYYGPEGKNVLGLRGADNLTSDIFFRSQIDLPALRAGAEKQSDATKALMAGYVAGYNRYLFDNPVSTLPEECRDAEVRLWRTGKSQRPWISDSDIASGRLCLCDCPCKSQRAGKQNRLFCEPQHVIRRDRTHPFSIPAFLGQGR